MDKSVAISQAIILNAFSWMKKNYISTRISLKFVPEVQNNNIPAWVKIMA